MSTLFRLTKSVISNPVASRNLLGRVTTNGYMAIGGQQRPPRAFMSSQAGREPSNQHEIAKVQCPAPDFKGMAVVNGQFKEISLADFAEVIAFNDRSDEFKQLNAEIVAVSVDSHFSHLAWVNTPRKNGGLGTETTMPILSDLKKTMAASYGCLTKNADVALRALYIIDTKGVIRQITINDLPVGRSVDEVLRLIKAFQFADEHGEVCPANWQPKAKTINPKKASEYFASEFSK